MTTADIVTEPLLSQNDARTWKTPHRFRPKPSGWPGQLSKSGITHEAEKRSEGFFGRCAALYSDKESKTFPPRLMRFRFESAVVGQVRTGSLRQLRFVSSLREAHSRNSSAAIRQIQYSGRLPWSLVALTGSHSDSTSGIQPTGPPSALIR